MIPTFTPSKAPPTLLLDLAVNGPRPATPVGSQSCLPPGFPVTGSATVTYSVQENTSSTRTGTLTIAGRTFLVTQTGVTTDKDAPCISTVSPTGQSLGAVAAVSNVAVTAPSGCSWTAANTASWVTITSGSSGSGDGTVTYSVTANTSSSSRTDTLTIAGKSFTVRQASPSSDTCTYNISPATQSFPYAGARAIFS